MFSFDQNSIFEYEKKERSDDPDVHPRTNQIIGAMKFNE